MIFKELRSTRILQGKKKKADGGGSSGIFSLMPCNYHISGFECEKESKKRHLYSKYALGWSHGFQMLRAYC